MMFTSVEGLPAVTDFGLPLGAPLGPRPRGHDDPERAHERQAQPERERIARGRHGQARDGLSRRGETALSRARKRPIASASIASPAPVIS